jgi:hypothetical protein
MKLFFHISGKYAFVAAAIFVLQLIPITGLFLMFLLGPFWIGVVVHVYMIQIAGMSMTGALPRLILLVPGAFYAAGLAAGLSSDIGASRWESQQQWVRIDKQVPADTHYVGFTSSGDFDAAIYWLPKEFSNQNGAFEPEKLGFELFSRDGNPDHRIAVDEKCQSGSVTIASRCYTLSPMDTPSSYLLIGGDVPSCPSSPIDGTEFSWGTVGGPYCTAITLIADGQGEMVGIFSGALLEERLYFLFPTAGCGLVDNPSSWVCEWYVSPRWRKNYVGYFLSINGSSPSSGATLMSALAQLRGQTLPQSARPLLPRSNR